LYSESTESDPDPSDAQRLDAIHYFLTVILSDRAWADSKLMDQFPRDDSDWWKAFRDATAQLPSLERHAVTALVSIPTVAAARIVNLIEFGRSVHAEMAAITDAARRGVAVQDATLYVTTFPCHECTRNIVAAGVSRVVYVEPYGKSLAKQLYGRKSVDFHSGPPARKLADDRVHFVPFVGIAPRCFDVLFDWLERKHDLGQLFRVPEHMPGAKRRWDRGANGRLRPGVLGYALDPNDAALKVNAVLEAAHVLAEVEVIEQVGRDDETAVADAKK
jgi:cytidine deaminase